MKTKMGGRGGGVVRQSFCHNNTIIIWVNSHHPVCCLLTLLCLHVYKKKSEFQTRVLVFTVLMSRQQFLFVCFFIQRYERKIQSTLGIYSASSDWCGGEFTKATSQLNWNVRLYGVSCGAHLELLAARFVLHSHFLLPASCFEWLLVSHRRTSFLSVVFGVLVQVSLVFLQVLGSIRPQSHFSFVY